MKLLKESIINIQDNNSGFAFIYFDNVDLKMHFMREFNNIKKVNIDVLSKQREKMGCKNWEVKHSPMPSNIFWNKFGQRNYFDVIVDWILNLFGFMFTVILITPINFTKALNEVITSIIGADSELLEMALAGTTPFVLVACNSLIIPQIVFWTTEFMYFETKS
jgi:hypothetical protein